LQNAQTVYRDGDDVASGEFARTDAAGSSPYEPGAAAEHAIAEGLHKH
jgi:hypothetical protein